MIRLKIFFLVFLPATIAVAQDPFFSQTYSAPMQLNPALAGSTGSGRVAAVTRTIPKGSDFDNAYKIYHFSYDQMINKLNSGIGIYYTGEDFYNDFGKSARVGINYAYSIKVASNLRISPAVELGYQIINFASYPNNSLFQNEVAALDPGLGLLINSNRLNVGVAVKHLLQPNLSPFRSNKGSASNYLLNADYVFGKADEKRSWKIAPGVRYNLLYGGSSATYNSLQLSFAAVYHKIKFGFAYRTGDLYSSDVAAVHLSYNGWLFKFRYAYDFFTGEWSGDRPQGHEVTLLFNLFAKKKKDDFVESPNFAF